MKIAMNHSWRTLAHKTASLCMLVYLTSIAGIVTAQEKNAIEGIQARQVGGNVVVTVSMKDPLAQEPIGFSVSNPARVVLDFVAALNATGSNMKELQVGDVRNVNVVQAEDRSRLVFNLKKSLNFTTETRGREVIVTIGE